MSTLTEAEPRGAVTDVELTYREAINAALEDEMAADDSVVLLGEDVQADGGVWKTNHGLVEKFGAARVRSTPICENAFMGVALGMGLSGLRPVVEIMFSDFLPTAGDAIVNELPKYRYMSGGQFAVPVTVRTVSGAGGRFGTQHSATGESWYMSLPGLRICAASSPGAAYELLRASIRDNNPVLIHEHRMLYGRKGQVRRGAIAPVGRAEVLRQGSDVTIIATLLMVERSLAAAAILEGEGISAEVIDLRWIRPLDLPAVTASLAKTGRLVIAEEQVHAGGWGATLISELTMAGQAWRSAPRTVSLPYDLPIPYSPPLEDEIIPSAERIAAAGRAALGR
ncbi:MAG TPA: transketolase C-terminal domain-containing protein [Candidatus Sulfomarinibacteraceae bacterium]|nr:transketolase C-terminal domain-containing protein [Candidatus Sulfomarinibacteraceae bacterium]